MVLKCNSKSFRGFCNSNDCNCGHNLNLEPW